MVSVYLENIILASGIDMSYSIASNIYEDIDDPLDAWLGKPKQPSPPISFNDDPVALTCTAYRIWKRGGPRWTDFDMIKPDDEDRVQAQELRRYYGGTMTFDALKGSGLKTTFRQKLYAIASNCHNYTKEDVGLLYRLPYLYEEDLCLDDLKQRYQTVGDIKQPMEIVGQFGLDRTMLHSRRSGEHYHYWLHSEHRQYLYNVVVRHDNPLRGVLESLMQQPRQYRATAYVKQMQGRRNFTYIQLGNLKLA